MNENDNKNYNYLRNKSRTRTKIPLANRNRICIRCNTASDGQTDRWTNRCRQRFISIQTTAFLVQLTVRPFSRDGTGSSGSRVTGSPGQHFGPGRVGSGHGSVSNTHDPVFWPGFGATKMYFLSTGALSLSACLAQAAQVGYQQFLSMFSVVASCLIAKPLLCCIQHTHAVNRRNIAHWDFDNIH